MKRVSLAWWSCLVLVATVGCNGGSAPVADDNANSPPAELSGEYAPDTAEEPVGGGEPSGLSAAPGGAAFSDPPESTPDAAAPTLQELLQKAQESLAANNPQAAVELVREALKDNPEDPLLLLVGAVATQALGQQVFSGGDSQSAYPLALESAGLAEKFLALNQGPVPPILKDQLSTIYYNSACASAVAGDTDLALKKLEQARQHSTPATGLLNLLNTDPDMDSLREDPRFQELIEKVQGGGAGEPEESGDAAPVAGEGSGDGQG